MIIWTFLLSVASRALGRYATPDLARAVAGGIAAVAVTAMLAWAYWSIDAAGYNRRDREVREALAAKNAEIATVMAENAAIMAANELARQAAVNDALSAVPKGDGTPAHLSPDLLARLNRIK